MTTAANPRRLPPSVVHLVDEDDFDWMDYDVDRGPTEHPVGQAQFAKPTW